MQVYLTNALEKPGNSEAQLTLFDDPLAFEAISANGVKKNTGINIVIGNPPYSNSSVNCNEWILDLISLYKEGLNDKKLNLDEDSIKFMLQLINPMIPQQKKRNYQVNNSLFLLL